MGYEGIWVIPGMGYKRFDCIGIWSPVSIDTQAFQGLRSSAHQGAIMSHHIIADN